MTDEQLLEQIRAILLRDDRRMIEEIRAILDDPELLDTKAAPVIEKHIDARVEHLRAHYEAHFGAQTEALIQRKIHESRDELLNVLYPAMGTMIRKFIQQQIKLLQESIEERLRNTRRSFSIKNLRRVFRRMFSGVNAAEEALADAFHPEINEVFVIQKGSGLMIGSWSRTEQLDRDIVAGMFTAIKSFAEDAFDTGAQELEFIEWQNYNIFLQSSFSYYIAVAVTGNLTTQFRTKLGGFINEFEKDHLRDLNLRDITGELNETVRQRLELHFSTFRYDA